MRVRVAWSIAKETANEFLAVSALSLSAATAYYAVFSLAPLLVLAGGLAGLVFGEDAVRREVGLQLADYVGAKSAAVVETMMGAQLKSGGFGAMAIGVIALVFGATAVFAQLQASLNTIWGISAKPGNGIWLVVRQRLLSMAMVLGIGFLLLVSMILSVCVSAVTAHIDRFASLPSAWIAPALDAFLSFVVTAGLFGLIFKVLPDVTLRWRDVRAGAIGTALLFAGGKYLLGSYLGHEITASAYGASSAFIVILLYVYYSSVILYLGAAFTKVYPKYHGSTTEPSSYAVPIADAGQKGKLLETGARAG